MNCTKLANKGNGNPPFRTMRRTHREFILSPPPSAARSFPDTNKTRVRDKYAYKGMMKNNYKVVSAVKGRGDEHSEYIGEGETSITVDKAGGTGGILTFLPRRAMLTPVFLS